LIDTIQYNLMAMAEVGGRFLVGRSPVVMKMAHRWVRRTSQPEQPIKLTDLKKAIINLGVRDNDILMVHSAWDGMRQLQAKPSEVIAMLRGIIGGRGTLIMPTAPIFTIGDNIPIYDVAKSPSVHGLLSECFRRVPGTKRSPFPMATVSAIGPEAELFSRDFRNESGNTPYGIGSPYWELGVHRGKVLVLGIDVVRTLTIQHCAFDVLGNENPVRNFYMESTFIVINDFSEEMWTIHRPRPELVNYWASTAWSKMIRHSGTCLYADLKGMKIALVDARAFFEWHLPLARKYGWPYWGYPKAQN
jgi:hypothetical protein